MKRKAEVRKREGEIVEPPTLNRLATVYKYFRSLGYEKIMRY